MLKKLIFTILLYCAGWQCLAQNKQRRDTVVRDTTVHYQSVTRDTIARDSTGLYKKIQDYSDKSQVTQWLHQWIFRPINHGSQKRDSVQKRDLSPSYAAFSGKIIRHVVIKTLDPFGYSVYDTVKAPTNWLEDVGNAVHLKSKNMAINKFFLFKKGDTLDPLVIEETARLLRHQGYVNEVRIVPKRVAKKGDSVDLVVRVLDSWSLLPKISLSSSSSKMGLEEQNFIGMGHRLRFDYAKRFQDGHSGFDAVYSVPNIRNTFINFTGRYAVNFDYYYDKYIAINRDFYSSFTRWAGGVFIQDRTLRRPWQNDTIGLSFFYQNYWVGHAFPLLKGDSKAERTTNLVVSARAYQVDFHQTPTAALDSMSYFSDENFYLASVGISSRRFVQDRFIFSDGRIEDVPVGTILALTGGVQHKHDRNRFYFGARAAYGEYFDWGFLSEDIELGSFISAGELEQTTLSFKVNYFSPLIHLGSGWKLRQFIKPQLVLGWNRLNSRADRLSLNESPYFRGVNSYAYVDYGRKQRHIDYKNGNMVGFGSPISGTKKIVLDLQTQVYSPWNFIGFHINPFFHASLGMLSGGESNEAQGKLYSSFSLGVIVRNDYLIFDSFQLSFSFYPSIPGEGYNVLKTNAFRTDDYGFQSFQLGQPRPVIYE